MDKKKIDLADAEVVPILRQEFIEGASFPSDVFLRIGDNRYVLVARQGDKASLIEMHLPTDVTYLYVRRTDFKDCVGQKVSVAGILIEKTELSTQKKAVFIARAAESVLQELEHLGITREAIEHARLIADNVQTLVEVKPDLFSMMHILNQLPHGQMRRSMAISAVSVMVAKNMGWTLPATLEKLAMSGLLVDVGLKELPKEILEKPRHELTFDERVLYETHPFRGAEILRSMPSVSEDLIAVVHEHHENATGQGYPRRLRDIRMNPLAKVICAVDVFCDLTMKHPNNAHPRMAFDAIGYMETTLGQPFNKSVFQALKALLQAGSVKTKAA